jgi:hypothetical protein
MDVFLDAVDDSYINYENQIALLQSYENKFWWTLCSQ